MRKLMILIFTIFSINIGCKPSVITDVKIEAKYSYSSDQIAIIGILGDIYEIDQEYLNYISLEEIADHLASSFYKEENEIGNWLKIKFGSKIREGEVIKIIYTYNNEQNGFDIIYKPYNKDIFSKNIISVYDFVSTLGNKEPDFSNSSSSRGTPPSDNRLTNTTWQSTDKEITINFGNGNFSLRYPSWGGEKVIAGTFTIVNDTVTLTNAQGQKWIGAIIGNTLSLSGDLSINGEFIRR